MSDFKENFKNSLKNKTNSIKENSSTKFDNLVESLSVELENELETNTLLRIKTNLKQSLNNIKSTQDHSELPSNFYSAIEEDLKKEYEKEIEPPVESPVVEDSILKIKSGLSESLKKIKSKIEFDSSIFDSIKIEKKEEPLVLEIPVVEELKIEDNKEEPISLIKAASQSITKEESIKSDSIPENYVNLFKEPNAPKVDPNIKAIQNRVKLLEEWLTKVSLAGPGSGEVNFKYLDDVDTREQSNNKFLTYDPVTNNYVFNTIVSGQIYNKTVTITSNTYTLLPDDYYIGINYAGPVLITIPSYADNGKMIIIKDESGHCSQNPITVNGNVDNDPGGFILKIDNGGIQMIYNNGWRIV
jgi:hypothetical protein